MMCHILHLRKYDNRYNRCIFKFYNEGENAKILLGVTISGKVQDKDLEFTVSVDPERTTLPATQYELPEKCVIKAGELTGEILVVLKYYENWIRKLNC